MDSGLGVRWPLSPYATALAAGALFAASFCIAFYRHRSASTGAGKRFAEVDPSGRSLAGDLDPKKEGDAPKPGKEKRNEKEATESAQNFPVLALRDVTRALSYEHLCLAGQFGAIPRAIQRNQVPESSSNLYPAFRWRSVKKEKKTWQDFNPTSSNFSCIYQQPPSLASELPRLNARFFVNISPHLQPYIGQFRDFQIPEASRKDEFANFDVALKPEILRNKPITRSAVCLALQRQLHKFLDEPFREIRFNERAIQTADITEEDDDDNEGASGNSLPSERNLNADSDTNTKSENCSDASEHIKKSGYDSSLWDSGYDEKAFDDRCSTPKEHNYADENALVEEYSETPAVDPNAENDNNSIASKYLNSVKEIDDNLINENVGFEKTYDIEYSFPKERESEESNMLDVEYVTESSNENQNFSDNLNVTCSKEISIKTSENSLGGEANNAQGDRDSFPEFSVEHDSELNLQASDIDTKIPNDEIKILSFEDNVDVYEVNKCSDKELERYRDRSDLHINMDSDEHTEADTLTRTSESKIIDFETLGEESVGSSSSCLEKVQDAPEGGQKSSSGDENLFEGSVKSAPGNEHDNASGKELDLAFTIASDDNNLSISKYSDLLKETGGSLIDEKEVERGRASTDLCNYSEKEKNGMVANNALEEEICVIEHEIDISDSSKTAEIGEISIETVEKSLESTRAPSDHMPTTADDNSENLEEVQNAAFDGERMQGENYDPVSADRKRNSTSRAIGEEKEEEGGEAATTTTLAAARGGDVTREGSSRDSPALEDGAVGESRGTTPRQMDRETGERSVAVESTVTTETTLRSSANGGKNSRSLLSTAVVSRLTLDDWAASFDREDSVSVKTTVVSEESLFRPTFEEFVALKDESANGKKDRDTDPGPPLEGQTVAAPVPSVNGRDREIVPTTTNGQKTASASTDGTSANGEADRHELPTSPRIDRLKGLISRDEERRSRARFQHLADGGGEEGMEGEWDRLLRDVLASVSELERWERRQQQRSGGDVSDDAEDAEQQHQHQHQRRSRRHRSSCSQSDSSLAMEEEEDSAATLSPGSNGSGGGNNKGETPTKVKNLRFKLDPDVFDVPSDDSFYDDDYEEDESRRGWKRQSKYRAFSSLELNENNEPVRLVSVHASVVPAGQKMVARPVGIDLRVRLTEERQSKRAHVSTSPSQAKRRSPVSDRSGVGWCQELSPVTENVDWRETFTPVTPPSGECKSVPNGILKTPSPKIEPSPVESPNPFKLENGVTTNGVTHNSPVTEKPKYNGWKPPVERKPFLIIRKKFEPDPEAIERITGYKSAVSKPPLPPPLPHKMNSALSKINRAELARKQYLDSNKALLSGSKVDGTKKFQQFLSQAQNDRAKIVTSVPDLAAIERAVTEQWIKERASVSPRESPAREDSTGAKNGDGVTLSRGSTPDDKWASYVQSCRQHLGRRSQSMTYLETDIDIIPVLDGDEKCHSTSVLDEPDEALPDPDDSDLDRSREDLDDSGRAKSEHELRIERSLRSLPLPDWYRRSDKTKSGFLLGSSSNSNKEKRGWAAVKSLASSTSSLASCGLRRPVRSLRSSRENIPWSRASPDGPTLSLALAKAFREPYLGWRARTPTSSGVSSSPRASPPPSWGATTTDEDDEANGVSFDGEDAFGRTTTSSEDDHPGRDEPPSLDDTGADAVTVSMDTNDPVKLPGGEDTCDDLNNMSMDTCELFDAGGIVVVGQVPPVDEDPSSPRADTGDDIDNLSTDTATTPTTNNTTEGRRLDPKLKRYSYSQSIYHSEWDDEEESRGDRKGGKKLPPGTGHQSPAESPDSLHSSSSDHKVVWIESSFVGSRTTTSIVVLPEKKGGTQERPASR